MDFKVIIAGSREYSDYEFLKDMCDYLLQNKISEGFNIIVISGHARGADILGERYANERGFKCIQFPAQWDKYGKSAGYRRNVEMAENANCLIAFFSDIAENKGTQHMVNIAREKGLQVREIKKMERN